MFEYINNIDQFIKNQFGTKDINRIKYNFKLVMNQIENDVETIPSNNEDSEIETQEKAHIEYEEKYENNNNTMGKEIFD